MADDESLSWPDFTSEESSQKFHMQEKCYKQLMSSAKHKHTTAAVKSQ